MRLYLNTPTRTAYTTIYKLCFTLAILLSHELGSELLELDPLKGLGQDVGDLLAGLDVD